MKSIMYTFLVLLAGLVSVPQIALAQTSEGVTVLSLEEFESAPEEMQRKVLTNQRQFVVVKDGQKVDVWSPKAESSEESSSDQIMSNQGSKGSSDRQISGITKDDLIEIALREGLITSVEELKSDPDVMDKLKRQIMGDGKSRIMRQNSISKEDFTDTPSRGDLRMLDSDGSVQVVTESHSEDQSMIKADSFGDEQKQTMFSGKGSITEEEYKGLTEVEKQEYVKERKAALNQQK